MADTEINRKYVIIFMKIQTNPYIFMCTCYHIIKYLNQVRMSGVGKRGGVYGSSVLRAVETGGDG